MLLWKRSKGLLPINSFLQDKDSKYMMYDRDRLLVDLRSNVVELHFMKTNGENRVMKCTLMSRFLPESYIRNTEEQNTERQYHRDNPNVIAAWDIDARGWRSFRIDSVTYCQALYSY